MYNCCELESTPQDKMCELILSGLTPPPPAAYMRQRIGPALVQMMACSLFGAQPLSETNTGLLSIESLETNFSKILIKMHKFVFKKTHLKMSSAKMAAILFKGR